MRLCDALVIEDRRADGGRYTIIEEGVDTFFVNFCSSGKLSSFKKIERNSVDVATYCFDFKSIHLVRCYFIW